MRPALSHTGSTGKLLGNVDLWYAVLWLAIEKGIPGTNYLQPILPQLRKQMEFRLIHHKTYASLQGLPEYVTTLLPLRVAIWYVLASPVLRLPPSKDPLRKHIWYVDELEQIMTLANIKVQLPASTYNYYPQLKGMLSIMDLYKKDIKRYKYIIHLIRLFYQNSIKIDYSLIGEDMNNTELYEFDRIPIDGVPEPDTILEKEIYDQLPKPLRCLDVPTLYTLLQCIESSDSMIPTTILPVPDAVIEWAYELRTYPRTIVPICMKTCRPYYVSNNRTWSIEAEEVFGIKQKDMISIAKRFAEFVIKYERYPRNPTELLLFTFHRTTSSQSSKPHTTLPYQIIQFTNECFEEYADIMATITVEQFIKNIKKSCNIPSRVAIESS
jgi:hypothetical protein